MKGDPAATTASPAAAAAELSLRESLAVARFNDNQTPRQIADAFGVSPWAIYKRLKRARAKRPDAVRRHVPTGRFRLLGGFDGVI